MRYKPPVYENRPQWVPIVAKDKSWLVGYISGIQMIESLIMDALHDNGIEIELKGLDLCLDSSRFNDVLENGKKESECTKEEIIKYYQGMVEDKLNLIRENHPDNDMKVFSDCFLEAECSCGLGIYSFKNPEEMPEENLKCQICGRVIIDYTKQNDNEFEFDGDTSRVDTITKEIQKSIKKRKDEE